MQQQGRAGRGASAACLGGAQRSTVCSPLPLSIWCVGKPVLHLRCPSLRCIPQGKAPIGAAAATTHDAVVDWGHLGADVVQYGGQDKRYDMVREEERPLPRGEGVRASAAGPARAGQDGPVAPGSGSNGAAALAPRCAVDAGVGGEAEGRRGGYWSGWRWRVAGSALACARGGVPPAAMAAAIHASGLPLESPCQQPAAGRRPDSAVPWAAG